MTTVALADLNDTDSVLASRLERKASVENEIRTGSRGDGGFHAVDRRRAKFSRPCFDVRDKLGRDFGRSPPDTAVRREYCGSC